MINNFIDYELKCLSSKIIKKSKKEKINLYNVTSYKNVTKVSIKYNDKTKFLLALEELNIPFTVIKSYGIHKYIDLIKNRIGVLIGLVLIISLMLITNKYCFFVTYTYENGTKYDLELNNIDEKVYLPVKVTKEYKTELKKTFLEYDQIANVNVKKIGMLLVVELKEQLPPAQILNSSSNESILAKHDAIVTKYICYKGTKNIVVGQSVKKGDILIENKIFYDENEFPSEASGEVYGRVFYHEQCVVYNTYTTLERTGNVYKYNQVDFMGINGKEPNSPYEKYEMETSEVILQNVLPLKVKSYIIYELSEVQKTFDEKSDLPRLSMQLEEKIVSGIEGEWEKLHTHTTLKKVDNTYIIDVYLEVEQRIDGG